MTTLTDDAREFCSLLHWSLSERLRDVVAVQERVKDLRSQNSFRESCFCKGCVLPIVDRVATKFLDARYHASREAVHKSLRCEGFETPLYGSEPSQVGFSSHSRSNSYHPGDKSGRRATSRRSPDFCVRFEDKLRMLGELKFVETYRSAEVQRLVHEMRDYLSIKSESTSDWGHDFGFGLYYVYGGDAPRTARLSHDYWESNRILISTFVPGNK
jgi:hypothetical protein